MFLETAQGTDGRLLLIDNFNPPRGAPEPEHVHPVHESGAEDLSGSLLFSVAGEECTAAAGESITIPVNTPHNFWNDGKEEAHAVQWFRPTLKTERFFESFFGLAQDGKFNDQGLPPLLQLAVMAPHFGDEIRFTRPPWVVQRVLFGMLAPAGRILGYRPEYPYRRADREEPTSREGERAPGNLAERGLVVATTIFAVLFALVLLGRRSRSKKG